MRLVAHLLLKESIKRTLFLCLVALLCLIGLQFLLMGIVSFESTVRRSICFGSLFGGAWTLVRWRAHGGNLIIETMGIPKSVAALIVSGLSSFLLYLCLFPMHQFNFFVPEADTFIWRHADTIQVFSRESLHAEHMIRAFDGILDSLHVHADHSWSRFLICCLPLSLFVALVHQPEVNDAWTSLGLTTFTYIVMEFWIRSYG